MGINLNNDELLGQAQEHFTLAQDYWSEIYQQARDDLAFMDPTRPDAQWHGVIYASRASRFKPCLTIDYLTQFILKVSNDVRQQTPSIKCIPADGASNDVLAEIAEGLIRDIEYQSGADAVYDTAVGSAVRCGIGWILVQAGYKNKKDEAQNLQTLFIKRVINPLSVYIDPNSIEADGSDAQFGFIMLKMSKKEFEKKYPKANFVGFNSGLTQDREAKDSIMLAHYFCKEEAENGEVVVRHCVINNDSVLEQTIFPGQYIPIVPVYGEETWSDGRKMYNSLIRRSKDSQYVLNLQASLETESLMKQLDAPVMAAGGAVENFRDDWSDPSTAAVLRYSHVDKAGNPIPMPTRLAPPSLPTGFAQAKMQAADDIKATLGLYNAFLGQRSNEQSGVAIAQRKQEGDTAVFHFKDNLNRSIAGVGKILLSAIPVVYGQPRIIRIYRADEKTAAIGINGALVQGQPQTVMLSDFNFDVKVVTGAPFATQRQEAATYMQEIVARNPDLLLTIGDIMFENMDIAGAKAVAERLKRIMPPNVVQGEQGQNPELQQYEMALQQAQQQLQQMQAQLMEAQALAKSKEMDNLVKIEDIRTEAQLKQMEFELRQQELNLEQQKLALEQYRINMQAKTAYINETTPNVEVVV
jgi:Phage P22-like portal protein